MALLKKLGLGNQYSDDSQFKELKKEFESSKRILDRAGEHLNTFLTRIDDLLKTQSKLSDEIVGIEEGTAVPELMKTYKATVDLQVQAKNTLDQQVRAMCLDPLNKYKGQYREIQDRIREHKRLGGEMEKLSAELRKAKEKNSALQSGIERRLNSAKHNYTDLHEELSHDIVTLVEDRNKFLEPFVVLLFNIEHQFYQNQHQAFSQFSNRVPNVPSTVLSEHPRAIRSRQDSAISRSHTTHMPSSTAQAPPAIASGVAPSNTFGQGPVPPSHAANQGIPGAQFSTAPLSMVQGKWDFGATDPSQLSFRAGDRLAILAQPNADWCFAEMNGYRGYIPSKYVAPI